MTARSPVGAHHPVFKQGDHAMGPRHQLGRSLLPTPEERNLVPATFALQVQVSQPAIGVDDTARFYGVLHKRHRACGRSVYNLARASPADAWPIPSSGNNHWCFFQVESAGQALLQTTHIALVHFDSAREQIPSRPYDGVAQFSKPRPGRLIFLQPQHSLQPQRAGAGPLGCHPRDGAKLHWQRSPRTLKSSRRSPKPDAHIRANSHRPRTRHAFPDPPWEQQKPVSHPSRLRYARQASSEARLQLRQNTGILPPPPNPTCWGCLSQGNAPALKIFLISAIAYRQLCWRRLNLSRFVVKCQVAHNEADSADVEFFLPADDSCAPLMTHSISTN